MPSKVKIQNPKSKSLAVWVIAHCLLPIASYSQCAMCRASLESTGDTAKAQGINDGIVYLMAIPYILVGIAGYFVYRMFAQKKAK